MRWGLAHLLYLLWRHFHFELTGNLLGDFALDRKNVVELAIEILGPQVCIGGCID